MKSRIFTLLSAIILGWCSCSDEIPAGGDEGTVDLTITTSFSVKGMDTKASVNVEAVKEQNVSDLAILVFRKVAGKDTLLGKTYIDEVTGGDVTKLTDTNVKIKSGDIYIVAVANALSKVKNWETGGGKTYTTFCQQVVQVDNFLSDKLIKFAVKEEHFSVEMEKNEDGSYTQKQPTIKIELIQLAARIDLDPKLVIDHPNAQDYSFQISKIKVGGYNRSSRIVLGDYKEGDDGGYVYNNEFLFTPGSDTLTLENNSYSFYSFEKKTAGGNPINLIVEGVLKKGSRETPKTYKLALDPRYVVSSNFRTNGFIHGYQYTAKGTITPSNDQLNLEIFVKDWLVLPIQVDYGK